MLIVHLLATFIEKCMSKVKDVIDIEHGAWS